MSDYQNIWVYAETADNGPAPVVYELLAKGRELADKTGEKLAAVLLGHKTGDSAQELLAYGADQVIRLESENLADYKPVPYAAAMKELVDKHKPSMLLFGATAEGRDLAPRLQAKLLTGLTADCLDLSVDEAGLLVQIKPSYGDNIMCTITCPSARPQMATVRPKVFSPLEKAEAKGEVIDEKIEVKADERYEVLGRQPLPSAGPDIGAADILVALGRGAAGEGAVKAAQELAELLRGAVAVTRPLTDDGQFSHDLLIGQSGLTVKPKCILNFGISGAIQYVVGMQNSGLIISVNKMEDAPIFGVSHYGVVSDAEETIKAIVEAIKQAN